MPSATISSTSLDLQASFLLALLLLTACEIPSGPYAPILCEYLYLSHHDPLVQTGDVTGVLSPAVVQQGDTYYLFSSGPGISVRRSDDLIHWEAAGQVFDSLANWTRTVIPEGDSLSSPEVAYFNGRYHLYYSLMSPDNQVSAIGLATNVTLNPMDPDYAWIDRGPVIESEPGTADSVSLNPGIVLDADGMLWLTWSASEGEIRLRRLDAGTGLVSRQDETVHTLAHRRNSMYYYAPVITQRNGWYYLFVSPGFYGTLVGRSSDIAGPYKDRAGEPMLEGGFTYVLPDSYGRIRSPGHSSVLVDGDRYFLVHNFLDTENGRTPTLQVRPLVWDEHGWPLAGEPYDGTFPIVDSSQLPDVVGTWSYPSLGIVEIRLMANGELEETNRDWLGDSYEGCLARGTWRQAGPTIVFAWSVRANHVDSLIVPTHGSWFVGHKTYPNGQRILIRGVRRTRGADE